MRLSDNTVLITGGGSGIGLALTERFLAEGSTVIIVGRSEATLRAAKEKHPSLITKACDVSDEHERVSLYNWVTEQYGTINVLINNAGIQRAINLSTADSDWSQYKGEIATNLEAPIHLSMMFAPYFMGQGGGTLINVSSRLGLMPAAWVPIYTSTKSALHFFTCALRLQMEKTCVKVFEILPTMVNTSLAGKGAQADGVSVEDFTDSVIQDLKNDIPEISYGNALSDDSTPAMMRKMSHEFWERFSQRVPGFENLT